MGEVLHVAHMQTRTTPTVEDSAAKCVLSRAPKVRRGSNLWR
jgi:hypothetical protein